MLQLPKPICHCVCIDIIAGRRTLFGVATSSKRSHLQIRVSFAEKLGIRRAADRAGMDMSAYVLSRVLSSPAKEFQTAVGALSRSAAPSYLLADINSLLCSLTAGELRDVIAPAPPAELSPFLANYVAAMIEIACELRAVSVPAWARRIAPLDQPVFGSTLRSLRLHLLTHSPAPFRRRNIFIDATLGDRV